MPRRLLDLYSLALMDGEGSVYGYRISDRIAERTDGAWRPGPGTVYPALRALVERGLARAERRARRLEYRITPQGRLLLRRVRARRARRPSAPDLSMLWAEIVGEGDQGEFMLRRVRRATGALAEYMEHAAPSEPAVETLRAKALHELAQAQRRLSAPRPRAGPRR